MKTNKDIWKKKIVKKTIKRTIYICKICGFEAKTEYLKGYHRAEHDKQPIVINRIVKDKKMPQNHKNIIEEQTKKLLEE